MSVAIRHTPRFSQLFLFLILGISLSACATIKSGSHYDESASYKHFKTFSWIANQPLIIAAGEHPGISPLAQKKIVKAIQSELTRKGFVYTADLKTADFILSYTVGTRDRIEVESYPRAYQGAWGGQLYGRYYYDIAVEHRMYTDGTLGVDIFDGNSMQPVWHGWATKTVSTADLRDPAPSIDKAVAALFTDFPPRLGKK